MCKSRPVVHTASSQEVGRKFASMHVRCMPIQPWPPQNGNIPKLCSLTTGMNSFHCYWSRLVKTTGLSKIHMFSYKKWTHSSRNLGRFLVLRYNPHILGWFLGMDLHWGSLLDGWNYHGTRKCRFPFRGRGAGNCRETAPGVVEGSW